MVVTVTLEQDDSGDFDRVNAVVLSGENDSVILGCATLGNWVGTNKGDMDFAAIKISLDGEEIWRWQVSVRGKSMKVSLMSD